MRHWLVRGIAHPRCNSRAGSIILRATREEDVPINRREVVQGMALGAVPLFCPFSARAQRGGDALAVQLQADLVRHAELGPKFSAGPGDNATAQWIAGELRATGYEVEESTFDAPFFVKRVARLVCGNEAVDVTPQAPVVPTSARGVTGPLALLEGEAVVGDLTGRIALLVAPFARHAALFADRGLGRTVTEAAHRGAAAIVIVTTGPSREAVALNAPEQQPFVAVPTAVLAPRQADAFVAAARAAAPATLVLDGDATHRPCKNIVGRLERGARWIGISTPRSGWYDCVAERGTGTAVFLDLAAWVGSRFADHSVFVMNTGGHEYFFAGSHRVIDEGPPPDATAVWAHIGATLAARDAEERDGQWAMLDTADPQRSLMTADSVRDLATNAFQGLSGLAEPTPIRAQAGELSTFTDRGYARAFAAIGQHRWFHTQQDTIECADARLLLPVLAAHRKMIELVVARDATGQAKLRRAGE